MSNEVKQTVRAGDLLNELSDLTPKEALSITSTLEEIGKWIQNSFKASAEDAWEKGRVFKLAKAMFRGCTRSPAPGREGRRAKC